MRLQLLCLVLFLAIPLTAAGQVQISQVLYNPVDESGGEAIELYNPTDADIDISLAEIRSESQATDATLPNETIIKSGSYYLIADVGWETSKEPSWPSADYEETLTFYNTDSGVALVMDATIIDVVGWGDPLEIDADLYEGTPAAPAAEGETLKRTGDTDNNSADFIADVSPQLHAAAPTIESGIIIAVSATILDSASTIIGFYLPPDEDELASGNQYLPMPGNTKALIFEAEVEDPEGTAGMTVPTFSIDGSMQEMVLVENLTATTALFETVWALEFYQPAGTYDTSVTLGEQTLTEQVEIIPIVAMECDTNKLSFESSVGDSSIVVGDTDMTTTAAPTIRNIGNTALDVSVYGDEFYSETDVLQLNAFSYSFYRDVFTGSLSGFLSSEPTLVALALSPGADATNEFSLLFEPLPGDAPGTYAGNIYLQGVAS